MPVRWWTALAVIGLATLLVSCGNPWFQDRVEAARRTLLASKRPREQARHRPEALGQAIDLSQMILADARTGAGVNMAQYMAAAGRDHLLLVFGSKDCATCNAEGARLRDQVITVEPLQLTTAGRRFEVIGISTDAVPRARLGGYLSLYPFVKWQDAGGSLMRTYFLPPGVEVKVPLTVMIDRAGRVLWRVLPDEANYLSVEDLLSRIYSSLGLSGAGTSESGRPPSTPAPDTPSPHGSPTPDVRTRGEPGSSQPQPPGTGQPPQPSGPVPSPREPGEPSLPSPSHEPAPDLGVPGPRRLEALSVEACGQGSTTLAAAVAGPAELRLVQVVRSGCDAACLDNAKQLSSTCGGGTCQAVTLVTQGAATATCAHGSAFASGGDALLSVFSTHFNWRYAATEGPAPDFQITVPAVNGPILLGFDRSGRLVYSHDGALTAGDLALALQAAAAHTPARGPDFGLYGRVLGSEAQIGFADWRLRAEYTVLSAFGAYPVPCGSCMAELAHWSAPGQLVDYCASHGDRCQVAALETHTPNAGESLGQYYNRVENGDGHGWSGLAARHLRVPLVLDPVPDPDGSNYLKRLFDGYMVGLHPEWAQEYRTFIYDREGKMVAAFRSEAPAAGQDDPVLATIKKLP